jgi:dUTP pyrophosphatase
MMEKDIREQLKILKDLVDSDFIDDDLKTDIRGTIDFVNNNKTSLGKITVPFINKSSNKNPDFATYGDSGFDLRANIDENVVLKPLERTLIPTGLFFELPKGYDMEIRSRSGLALKNGIMVLNSPGTIDWGYRSEIKIILINLGQEDFIIKKGDRIAQGLIRHSITTDLIELKEVSKISTNTERGFGGFGHSGIQ